MMDKDMQAEVMKMASDAGLMDFRMTDSQQRYGSYRNFVRFEDGRHPNQIGIDRFDEPFENRDAELESYRSAITALAAYRARKQAA